jgi:hypothetical protein
MLEMFRKKDKPKAVRGAGGREEVSLNLVTLLYLVASICFIQALKGLSHPTTSIRGNLFGMVGMAIAAFTTAALIVKLLESYRLSVPVGLGWILLGLVVGGGYGAWRAKTVQMTQMPELVAFFHSMIGMAAVFIAVAAAVEPYAFGIVAAAGGGRRGRPDPDRQPARADPRRGDRRDHLQRLGDRLGQALGQVEGPRLPGRAGHVQGPALAQPRARDRDGSSSSSATR